MDNEKKKTLKIAQYLVSKGGAKYLKFSYGPDADQATKDKVEAVIAALGTDIVFMNVFDADFKAKYNVPEFVKGNVSVPLEESPAPSTTKAAASAPKKTAAKGGVDW